MEFNSNHQGSLVLPRALQFQTGTPRLRQQRCSDELLLSTCGTKDRSLKPKSEFIQLVYSCCRDPSRKHPTFGLARHLILCNSPKSKHQLHQARIIVSSSTDLVQTSLSATWTPRLRPRDEGAGFGLYLLGCVAVLRVFCECALRHLRTKPCTLRAKNPPAPPAQPVALPRLQACLAPGEMTNEQEVEEKIHLINSKMRAFLNSEAFQQVFHVPGLWLTSLS